jgi:hypothetical protein
MPFPALSFAKIAAARMRNSGKGAQKGKIFSMHRKTAGPAGRNFRLGKVDVDNVD